MLGKRLSTFRGETVYAKNREVSVVFIDLGAANIFRIDSRGSTRIIEHRALWFDDVTLVLLDDLSCGRERDER